MTKYKVQTRGRKTLACCVCGKANYEVSLDTTRVLCSKCLQEGKGFPVQDIKKKTAKPVTTEKPAIEKPQRKRGRPRKNPIEPKLQKRRGRPPKNRK